MSDQQRFRVGIVHLLSNDPKIEVIGREELQIRSALGLIVPADVKDDYEYTNSGFVKCNNKNCNYQDILSVKSRRRVNLKEIRCFQCNRSYFNWNEEKTWARLSSWNDIKHLIRSDKE